MSGCPSPQMEKQSLHLITRGPLAHATRSIEPRCLPPFTSTDSIEQLAAGSGRSPNSASRAAPDDTCASASHKPTFLELHYPSARCDFAHKIPPHTHHIDLHENATCGRRRPRHGVHQWDTKPSGDEDSGDTPSPHTNDRRNRCERMRAAYAAAPGELHEHDKSGT